MTQETMWIVLEKYHVAHDPHTRVHTHHTIPSTKGQIHFLEISEAESHVWIEFIQYYSASTGGNSRDCRKHKTVFLEAPNLPNIITYTLESILGTWEAPVSIRMHPRSFPLNRDPPQ